MSQFIDHLINLCWKMTFSPSQKQDILTFYPASMSFRLSEVSFNTYVRQLCAYYWVQCNNNNTSVQISFFNDSVKCFYSVIFCSVSDSFYRFTVFSLLFLPAAPFGPSPFDKSILKASVGTQCEDAGSEINSVSSLNLHQVAYMAQQDRPAESSPNFVCFCPRQICYRRPSSCYNWYFCKQKIPIKSQPTDWFCTS